MSARLRKKQLLKVIGSKRWQSGSKEAAVGTSRKTLNNWERSNATNFLFLGTKIGKSFFAKNVISWIGQRKNVELKTRVESEEGGERLKPVSSTLKEKRRWWTQQQARKYFDQKAIEELRKTHLLIVLFWFKSPPSLSLSLSLRSISSHYRWLKELS